MNQGPIGTAVPIFASSPAMAPVRQLLESPGSITSSVLIAGEPGSGRETLARALHSLSPHPERRFVAVDCAATPPDAFDAELFGDARPVGDAREAIGLEPVDRTRRLGEALGGTLFLKGLAAAPPQVQARLARVLRAKMARDVRTRAPFPVDVRVMAAIEPIGRPNGGGNGNGDSNGHGAAAPIARALDEQFAVRVDLPALRKRREDIPALADWLLERWCSGAGVPRKALAASASALLASLRWTGNAHELRAFLEAVASHVSTPEIGAEQLLAHIRLESGALAAYRLPLREARRRFEREYIAAILEQHHGRVSNAAQELGIKRTNLYRKLRQLRVARTGVRTDTQNRRRA